MSTILQESQKIHYDFLRNESFMNFERMKLLAIINNRLLGQLEDYSVGSPQFSILDVDNYFFILMAEVKITKVKNV